MAGQNEIANLLVTLGLDTKDFDKNISQVNRTTSQLEKGFKEAQKSIALGEKSFTSYSRAIQSGQNYMTQLSTKMSSLNTAYDTQKQKIQQLVERQKQLPQAIAQAETKLNSLAKTVGKGSEEYKKADKELENLKAEYNGMGTSVSNAVNGLRGIENQMSNTQNKMRDAQNTIQNFSREMNGLNKFNLNNIAKGFENLGTKIQNCGNNIKDISSKLAPLSAVASGALIAMSKAGIDLEYNLAKVGTLVGKNGQEMLGYKDKIKEFASSSGQNMNDFSKALYDTVSATGKLDESISLTSEAGKLAIGGFTNIGKSVDILTTAINGYGLSMDDSARVANVLISTQNKGKTTVDQLASSLGDTIPIAKDANFNIEELGTAMALLTSKGISTSQSATILKNMLSELTKSGSESDKALRELSGKGFADLKKEGKPTSEILNMLSEYAKKSGKTLKDMFGSVEAGSGALVLASSDGEEFNKILEEITNSSGASDKAFKEMSNTAQGKLNTAINDLKNNFIELGIKLIPTISNIVSKVSELAEKFSNLSPETQNTILKFVGLVAIGAPLLSMFGNIIVGAGTLIKGFGGVFKAVGKVADKFKNFGSNTSGTTQALDGITRSATASGGKFDGLKEKIGGLITKLGGFSTVAVPLAVGALIAIMDKIGENEGAILRLQEKWGGLGTFIGGVCEFVSGIVQITFGQIINVFMFLFDVIGAIIDGKGNDTVKGAWERFNARQELTVEEGWSKVTLSTTRGMSTLRHLQDTELNAMTLSLQTTFEQIPTITQENYDQVVGNVASSLSTLNNNQLLALTNLNDTTRTLFGGVREGMTIEQIIPILQGNFEQIKNSGKWNIEDMKDGISEGMETVKGQLDNKTAEGADAVSDNMDEATSAMNEATGKMASDATSGMAQVAGNMIDGSGKIPPKIESNMKQSADTIKNTLSSMALDIEDSFSRLTYNSEHYLGRIVTKAGELGSAFSSCAGKISSFASNAETNISRAKNSIISDWNSVINTLNRNITGNIKINKTIQESVIPAPASFINDSLSYIQNLTRNLDYRSSRYQPNTVVNKNSVKSSDATQNMYKELKEQNNILMQMLGVLIAEKEINVETAINLDGRQIARSSAKYIETEINTINKRKSRIGGLAY